MTTRIKLRRDTAANWTANNPILALGEPGLDTDNNAVKYGDGVTTWNNLPYSGEGATENIWLAVGSDCNSGRVKVSTDGVKWTESFAPMPRQSTNSWQNFWWAKPLGGKVIYDMYVDYLGTETLGWSDNALDYPNPVTFTNLPTTDAVDTYDWWDVFYVNGKYIAVGGYFEVATPSVERPMFATSDDGKSWTYGAIDDTYTSGLVSAAAADPTGIRITSVAYNGVGYLFALEWDHQFGGSNIGSLPPGFFYVTSLSATLNATNHINPSIDNNAGLKGLVWNHDHWAAYGHQNVWNRASLFINPNVNPATGNWTEISLNSTASNGPQKSVFGTYPSYGNTLAAFTTGKIGDYYWDVMALNNGRIMATKDKGVTWIGSVPFNLYSNIDTVTWDATNTKITFEAPGWTNDGSPGDYAPTAGERIDIRYGNVAQLRGFFYLGAQTASDGSLLTWTIYSDRALTQHVNSSAWAENYDTSNNNGYAVVTFSRDSDGYDPLTFGGFDQVKIADGKIVAINGGAWACSTDLLQWQLSLNTDVFTSGSYGTSGLEYGTAGSTNRSSLTYASDTNYVTEVFKEVVYGPNPPKNYTWGWDAMGNYVNQLALAENFKVSIGSGLGASDGFAAPMTMGMELTGHWWIGHDNYDNTNVGTYTPPSIGSEDKIAPGFDDVVIRTDGGDNQWVFNRNGATHFPNYTFPHAGGTANQVLKTDGSGNLTWSDMSGGSTGDITFTNTTLSAPAGGEAITSPTVTGLAWSPSGHAGVYVVTIGSQADAITYHSKVKFYNTGVTGLDGNSFYLSPIDASHFGIYTDWATTVPLDASGFNAWSSGGSVKVLTPGSKISITTATPAAGEDPGGIEFKIGGKTYGWNIDKDNNLRLPADGGQGKILNYNGHSALYAKEAISVTSISNGTSALTLKANAGIPISVTKTSSNQGWGNGSVGSNLATTGGSGTGLTVDVVDTGSAYAGITIHTPGSGYLDGETLTVSNGGMSDTFTVTVGPTLTWIFGTDGKLALPGDLELPSTNNIIKSGNQTALFKNSVTFAAMGALGGGVLTSSNFTICTVNNNDGTYALTFRSTSPTAYSWSGFGMDMTNGTPINVWGAKFTATANQDYTIATFETVGDTFQIILTDYTSGIPHRITSVLTSTTSSSTSIERIA
jgi:Major tropism determinant N-terminal domain